jgi:hypothetical protein
MGTGMVLLRLYTAKGCLKKKTFPEAKGEVTWHMIIQYAHTNPLQDSMRGTIFVGQQLAAAIRSVSTNTDSSFLMVSPVLVEIATAI